MSWISIDFESSSAADIKLGAYHYVTHESTRIIMMAYRCNGQGDVKLWWPGMPCPPEIVWALAQGAEIRAWNAFFELCCWSHICVPQFGFPFVEWHRFKDSIIRAVSANMPRALERAGSFVGAVVQKDTEGSKLMKELTNQKKTPFEELWKPHYHQRLIRLGSYCCTDVATEEAIVERTPEPPMVYPWRDMPRIDQDINLRGVMCDRALVRGMREAAAKETTRMDASMKSITNGRVATVSKVEDFKNWLLDFGVKLPKIADLNKASPEDDVPEEEGDAEKLAEEAKQSYRLRKNDVVDLLAGNLPGDVTDGDGNILTAGLPRLALQMRQDAAKISVKKLDAMDRAAAADDRLRGALIYMGAQQTGRFSGAVWQPHNFPRRALPDPDDVEKLAETYIGGKIEKGNRHHKEVVHYFADKALAEMIEAGRSGDNDFIREKYGAVLEFVSRMLRRTLCAPAGHVLLQGDFAQIEARITAWLAGQMDVIQAFAEGKDVYKQAAAPMVGKTMDALSKEDRQLGKVGVLGLGFGGGAGVFVVMSMGYGIRISREKAKPIVYAWRDANPEICKLWYATKNAYMAAMMYPGRWFEVAPLGLIAYMYDGYCLYCRLPSGRFLRYWSPRFEGKDDFGNLVLSVLSIKGRAVIRRRTWHGLFVENFVQAIAVDLLCGALEMMDRYRFQTVLHVHDSIAAEVPEDRADELLKLFRDLMLVSPNWTKGLPTNVDTHYAARFG